MSNHVLPIATRGLLAASLALSLGLITPRPAQAQDEGALRTFFEGRRVVLRMDMPGSSDGVDVNVGSSRPIDYNEYGSRMKRFGTAIREGDAVMVTQVKIKKDLIEFQLAGGGYGTFWDDTSTNVYIPYVEKSRRERELDRLIDDERDRERRRRYERERDDLRERRERENRRIDARRAEASAAKADQVMDKRLNGGSRFNIRYSGSVPAGIRPEHVMSILEPFVDFGTGGRGGNDGGYSRAPLPPPVQQAPPRNQRDDAGFGGGGSGSRPTVSARREQDEAPDMPLPRKGMSRDEAERLYGRPTRTTERREGSVIILTLQFAWGDGDDVLSAEFIEGILVKYAISSK